MPSVVEKLRKEKAVILSEVLSRVCTPWPPFSGDSEALSHMDVPVPSSVHVEAELVTFFVQGAWSQLGRPDAEPGEGCRTYSGMKMGGSGKERSVNVQ